MSNDHNTLFLRPAGPMQSWETSSRFQLRRTDAYPSKSGVLGMLLCAKGIRREDSEQALKALSPLLMGVRIDRRGTLDWDYHTAGAKIGIRRADGKGPKVTASTGEYEASLSRRQYLHDASFLVALQGDKDIIAGCACALRDPIWPLFLGRKCCVPAEPIFAGTGTYQTLTDALSSVPWSPRINSIDREDRAATRTLEAYLEHPQGLPPPKGARIVHDVPRAFGFWGYSPRWIVQDSVTVAVGEETQRAEPQSRASGPDRAALARRLILDHYLCVFCKAPADEVHHVSYENFGHETDAELRSLCKTCHRACTMVEYGHDMRRRRVDPLDPAQRLTILNQIERLLKEGNSRRWRDLLNTARGKRKDFFDATPSAASDGGYEDAPIAPLD